MEFICDYNGVRESSPQNSTLAAPEQWLVDCIARANDAGVPVNWRSSLGITAVWYCINTISNDIAQLPLPLYYTNKDGDKEEDLKHPGGKIMRRPTAGTITAFHLRKLIQTHALLFGNGRAFIVQSGRYEPAEFIPLDPERTKTVVVHDTELGSRQKWHVFFPETGSPIPIPDDEVLHIFGTSYDGYSGVSPLDILKNGFGLTIAGEKSASTFYKNGGIPAIVLEAPAGMFRDVAAAEEFLRLWNQKHSGADNAHRTGLLREGMKANPIGMKAADAQMLEQREFQVREVMRVFGMPMIPGVSDSQSYNSLEQLNRAYLLHCLGPWMRTWEAECNKKLLTAKENRLETHYFEFDSWELIKPDASQRAEMLTMLKSGMIITSNEARNWEGLPPLEGGDVLENPNTTPGGAGAVAAPEKPKDDKAIAQPDDDNPAAKQKKLIAAKLQPLISAESARAVEMSVKARDFLDWMNSFYAKHEPRLTEAVLAVGGEAWIAAEYVENSKYQLTQVASKFPAAEFPKQIELATAAWPDRADSLAASIIGVQAHG